MPTTGHVGRLALKCGVALVVAVCLGSASIIAWPTAPNLVLENDEALTGLEAFSGERVQIPFTFRNSLRRSVVIEKSQVSCSCIGLFEPDGLAPLMLPRTVNPGATFPFALIIDTNRRFGDLDAHVVLLGRDGANEFRVTGSEKVLVRSRFEVTPAAVVFENCRPGQPEVQTIVVNEFAVRGKPLELKEIRSSRPEFLHAEIVGQESINSPSSVLHSAKYTVEVQYEPSPAAPSRTDSLALVAGEQATPVLIPVRIEHATPDYVAIPDSLHLIVTSDAPALRTLRCRANRGESNLTIQATPDFLNVSIQRSVDDPRYFDVKIEVKIPPSEDAVEGDLLIWDAVSSEAPALTVPVRAVRLE